jgi:hypothetical protein
MTAELAFLGNKTSRVTVAKYEPTRFTKQIKQEIQGDNKFQA